MEGEGELMVRGRVEIDTRQPFRSVKEAVILFGEKVLAGEICVKKIKEMQTKACDEQNQKHSMFNAVAAELQETKQTLEKAKQEGNMMSLNMVFLRQELEQTKRELQQLKSIREVPSQYEPDIEDIKFVENSSKVKSIEMHNTSDNNDDKFEFIQRKRSVKFANPPMLAEVIVDGGEVVEKGTDKKQKKKPLIPIFGRIFRKG